MDLVDDLRAGLEGVEARRRRDDLMDLVDDLRAGLEGVGQLVDGGRKVANAAGAVADRVDVGLEHVTSDETVARVAQAALGARIEAAGHEIRIRTAGPVVRIREREPRKRTRDCLGSGRAIRAPGRPG